MLTSNQQLDEYIQDELDRINFEIYQEKLRSTLGHGYRQGDEFERMSMLKDTFADFSAGLASWSSFLTLTFRDPVGGDVALAKLKSLIALLSKRIYGKSYSRYIGHSYFSYMVGVEYQRRDVIHFHMLVDKPIDYQLIHTWWNAVAGFAFIIPIEDRLAACTYVAKYMMKGGLVQLYKAAVRRGDGAPKNRPIWWR